MKYKTTSPHICLGRFGLGGIRTSTRYDKLRESGRCIKFAIERPFGKEDEEHLGRGAHDASPGDVAAHHSAAGIGDAHVEVKSITRNRSVQSQDFKIAT